MGCLKIKTEEMHKAIVATLTGNVAAMREVLSTNGGPVIIAHWSEERRGVSSEGILNSFQLAQAMNDSLLHDQLYKTLRVEEMWNLHKDLFPNIKRTTYDQFGFIIWNWMDEPGDNPYFDEDDEEEFAGTDVDQRDICLANYAIQHMEKEVVELLKAGASPYFLVTTPSRTEIHYDKDGVLRHSYFDVAPMLEVTKLHSDDYWMEFIGGNLEKDISALPINTLENVVEGIFNVAACERILHLTEQYISDEARAKGEKMMLEHLGKIYSIIK